MGDLSIRASGASLGAALAGLIAATAPSAPCNAAAAEATAPPPIVACITFADNAAQALAADSGTSNRWFAASYASVFVTTFGAIIGGAPDGIVGFQAISAHIHSGIASGTAGAVNVRFYDSDGCDMGRNALLALPLFKLIIAAIGTDT